jgi:hypothetical protein
MLEESQPQDDRGAPGDAKTLVWVKMRSKLLA